MSADEDAMAGGPADWIVAIGRERHRGCFATLFTHFAPRVKAFLMRHGVGDPMAEELTQDVFLAVWRHAHSFDPQRATPAAWIFTITRNRWIDAVRHEAHPDDGRAATSPRPEPTPEDRLKAAQDEARIRAAIATLPLDQAQVLRLSYFDDLSHAEIAQELGLPLGTVKSRLRLATAHLRVILEDRR